MEAKADFSRALRSTLRAYDGTSYGPALSAVELTNHPTAAPLGPHSPDYTIGTWFRCSVLLSR